ncbi:MAG: hypothetical protein DME53_01035 [Verrucomicrobia bacterium]|nr:MAG: hypothetical protein DME53_01035 [Verrucomicrobiota bacterium]
MFYGRFDTILVAGWLISTRQLTFWICAACSFRAAVSALISFRCSASADFNSAIFASCSANVLRKISRSLTRKIGFAAFKSLKGCHLR